MKWTALALLLLAATVWAYAPVPVQKSTAEINLKAALDKADSDAAKAKIATEFLDTHPTDVPAARLAQDAILKTVEDGNAFFKARAEKSESAVDHYLYGRASGDSTVMAEQAAWIMKKDPKNTWGHMLAGLAEWEKASPDNSIVEKHLKDAIEADPSRPEGYINLGYLYEDMENWQSAREAFDAGAITDPANTALRDARLTAYATLHDGDAYFKLLDGVLPKEPLAGTLAKANNGEGNVDMAQALKGKVTVIEYWAYT
jgi:tetratricopeptide (TPR) repeat protein